MSDDGVKDEDLVREPVRIRGYPSSKDVWHRLVYLGKRYF